MPFEGWDKLISRIGKYTSSCVLIISIFIGSFSTYSEDPTDIFISSTLGGAWACQRQSCRIGRIFLLEWHEPVLASGSQNGSGDGRHQRGHDELSGSSIWRGQRVRPWKRGEQPVLFELQSALCISKKFRLWWYTYVAKSEIWTLFFQGSKYGIDEFTEMKYLCFGNLKM